MKTVKMGYQEPDMQILLLEEEDVVAVSGPMIDAGSSDGSTYDWSDFFDDDF